MKPIDLEQLRAALYGRQQGAARIIIEAAEAYLIQEDSKLQEIAA